MTAPTGGNWQTSAKSAAATVLLVAFALYLAVRVIDAVAKVLIVIATVGAFAYALALFLRYKRSRW